MDTRTYSKIDQLLRILRFPLVSMTVLYFSLYYVNVSGIFYTIMVAKGPFETLVVGLLNVFNMLLVYVSFACFVEKRTIGELALPQMGRELSIGLLLGFGLMSLCVLIALALGVYRINGIDSWHHLLPTGVALSLPFFEELVFRGVAFRILEEKLGSWLALVLSSLLFGGVHMANQGESLVGVAAIAFVYGPMLTAPFMVTRRLWTSIGLHGAWNYTMGRVFSVPVSGVVSQGLIKATYDGPALLTGGRAGIEGSLITILVGMTATIVMLVIAVQRGNVIQPFWRRRS